MERLSGGFEVIDANGRSLTYFYARENDHDAHIAKVLTMDEARRMAVTSEAPRYLLKAGERRASLRSAPSLPPTSGG